MKILIAGASGFIGKALAAHFRKNHQVLALSRQALDITNREASLRVISSERPELIVNCAVLGVEQCEQSPAKAADVNINGPENLARAARNVNAEILHISTNYVFDGRRKDQEFYTPDDTAEPINLYGKTKLAGEQAVRAIQPDSYIVRTSWIFGQGKENFFCRAPRLLKLRERIQALTDVRASATYLPDFVQRVAEIVDRRYFGTYHVVNQGLCSYYDFAVEAARLLKIDEAEWPNLIEPVTQRELSRRPRRPAFTPMRCLLAERLGFRPLRDWRAGLAEYVLHARC